MAKKICDSHHHRRHLRSSFDEKKPFRCSRCYQKDFGTRLACEKQCGYVIHKDCSKSQMETLTHRFFPGCTFYFVKRSELKRHCDACYQGIHSRNRYCDACGKDVHGYFYHCFDRGFDLHPRCANLEHNRIIQPERGGRGMLLTLNSREESECFFCGKKRLNSDTRSWTYALKRETNASKYETYHFHVACLKEESIEAVEEGRKPVIEKLAKRILSDRPSRSPGNSGMTVEIVKMIIRIGLGVGLSFI